MTFLRLSLQGNLSSAPTVLQRAKLAGAITAASINEAQGIVIISIFKGAYIFSGSIGRGLYMKRLGKTQWSPPVAMALAQAGVGIQFGAQKEQLVIILRTKREVDRFESAGQLNIQGAFGVAAGSAGASGKTGVAANYKTVSGHGSLSHTQGMYFGMSLEGAAILSNAGQNSSFYGKAVSQSAILQGKVEVPAGKKRNLVIALHHALENMGNSRAIGFNAEGLQQKIRLADLPVAKAVDEAEIADIADEDVVMARSSSFVFA